MTIKFEDFFNIKKQEEDLDFVNIPLDTDAKLYIDAYMISKPQEQWFVEANNLIVDYFEELLNAIREEDYTRARNLLSKLNEPNETHFGLSSNMPDGCGIGSEQAELLLEKLINSRARKTGHLKDLSDCELLINGIGADKISDITTNIIRGKLIEYTQDQCKELGIPVRRVESNFYWSSASKSWEKCIAMLPHYNNKPILLVPKCIVREKTVSNYKQFYNIVILGYYRDLNIQMNTNLVKVLKNGKRIVRTKDLRKKYKCSKEFVLEFTEEHPEYLEKYKRTRI